MYFNDQVNLQLIKARKAFFMYKQVRKLYDTLYTLLDPTLINIKQFSCDFFFIEMFFSKYLNYVDLIELHLA